MKNLESAVDRLLQAVTHLERAASARAESERLLAEDLAAARAAGAAEVLRTDDLSRRLEAAIGRLEAVLES